MEEISEKDEEFYIVLIHIEEKTADRNQDFFKSNIKENRTKKIPDMYIVNGSRKSMIMLIFSLSLLLDFIHFDPERFITYEI